MFQERPKIWLSLAAHMPMNNIDTMLSVLDDYQAWEADIDCFIYIDHESKDVSGDLQHILDKFENPACHVVVASPIFKEWVLTWAHKFDLIDAVKEDKYDYYIYAENDMHLTWQNFTYWAEFKPLLAPTGFRPGFCRYEKYRGHKVPFDNFYQWDLRRDTLNVHHGQPFTMSKIPINHPDVNCFVTLGNPYYGAMILDREDAVIYIHSKSINPDFSRSLTGIRNWPLADCASMGLAFEDIPHGAEHRRVVPLKIDDGNPAIPDFGLVWHHGTKYTQQFINSNKKLITCDRMFV